MGFKAEVGQSMLRTIAILTWIFVVIGVASGFDYGLDGGNVALFSAAVIVALATTIGAAAISRRPR